MFSLAETKEEPQEKRVKLEGNVKEEYQEYFEHASVKQDAPPTCEAEQDYPQDLGTSEAQIGVSETTAGILQERGTEPDGPTMMESDGAQVECTSVTSSAQERI